MQKLDGVMRAYPWGSRTLLAQLRGREVPAAQPEAELWFGAHPSASSTVGERGVLLDALIAADPLGQLGERVVREFGERLPFLLKLLAADEPLSIQAHPSLAQAREGYERENERGIALDDPDRNYRDANHKPELIVALSEFHALAGFRPIAATRELFAALNCPALDRYTAMIDDSREEESLRALFTTWISIPSGKREQLLSEVVAAASRCADDQSWIGRTARNVLGIVEQYPSDSGALAALLLNHIEMQPGQGLFLDAGQLHAYLRGLGVEIMASSDNVLRGGLTTKHVDVPELVRILDFAPSEDPFAPTAGCGAGAGADSDADSGANAVSYLTPCSDFALQRHRLEPKQSVSFAHDGPAIVLCTSGQATATNEEEEALRLAPGEAVWVPASQRSVTMTADDFGCDLFHATV